MSATAIREAAPPTLAPSSRKMVHRTRGRGHGPIVRLMSPSDLGEHLKPFVFLDLFEADMRAMSRGMSIHPHSGIATVTVFTDGDVTFDDPEAGHGTIGYGGVEWMRAGGGVWHGQELSAGASATVQGFQLWVALPPELENGEPESQYIEADAMARAGPAHVIVGAYGGTASPVRAPGGINYLLVTLKPGERWTYEPPAGHSVAWVAVAKGGLLASEQLSKGDMAIFEAGEAPIMLQGGEGSGTTFVLGSAVPHPHDLHLGYYSVHTSAQALAAGERRIEELGERLRAAGNRRTASGSTPVFR
ncbi:pirin [Microvirga vignae]|uniref:Pirin n=1 Tax=Microvirga vignae TaxID=1225564 RepID=A0A0H1RCI0_9HYPH|nr:pirin family protein [Microvirga vignae]KLK92566.1 pirin [Microvirga vignae]